MAVLVSPGINVSEIDQTTVTPTVSSTTGALAGLFSWGPIENPILVSGSEANLVKRFGKPNSDNYETFFTAANFISYGGALYVNRAGRTVGFSNTFTTVLSSNTTAVIASNTTGILVGHGLYGAGVASNTTVSNVTANATHTIVTLSSNALVTSSNMINYFDTRVVYNAVANSATALDRSQYIIKNEEVFSNININAGVEFVAKYPSDLGNSLEVSVCGSPNQFASIVNPFALTGFTNTTIIPSIGGMRLDINSAVANVYISNSATLNFATTYTAAGALRNSFSVGDYIEVGNTSIGKQSLKIKNITPLANTNPLAPTGEVYFNFEFEDIYNRSTNFVANTISRKWEYFNVAPVPPKTSAAALKIGSSVIDEISVVVVDKKGLFTGTPGSVLEVFPNLSRGTNSKASDGTPNYYKTVINNQSGYIWNVNDISGLESGLVGAVVSPTSSMIYTKSFVGGTSGPSESDVSFSTIAPAIDVFANKTAYDISLVMAGKAIGVDDVQSVNYIIDNITSTRKDCVLFASPSRNTSVNVSDQAEKIKNWNLKTRKGSYSFIDSGYKYQEDRYNDVQRWIPLNGDIAGLAVRTDIERNAWNSPAGYNRGVIKNVIRLALNPNEAERDLLFLNYVNPVVSFPGKGTILFGDTTNTGRAEAFDELGIRRLFIGLEKKISIAAERTLFEFNDDFTRSQFKNLVEPELRGNDGIEDFRVVCDTSNNTPSIISQKRFVGDIYIRAKHSIRFIQLNFIASDGAVSFTTTV